MKKLLTLLLALPIFLFVTSSASADVSLSQQAPYNATDQITFTCSQGDRLALYDSLQRYVTRVDCPSTFSYNQIPRAYEGVFVVEEYSSSLDADFINNGYTNIGVLKATTGWYSERNINYTNWTPSIYLNKPAPYFVDDQITFSCLHGDRIALYDQDIHYIKSINCPSTFAYNDILGASGNVFVMEEYSSSLDPIFLTSNFDNAEVLKASSGWYSERNINYTTITYIHLSGRITDSIGTPISGLRIKTNDVGLYSTTDANGEYSFLTPTTTTSPSGFTNLQLVNDAAYNNPPVVSSLPTNFTFSISGITLSEDTTLNLVIPTNSIHLTVLYPDQTKVENAIIQVFNKNFSIPIQTNLGAVTALVGTSENASTVNASGRTDSNGEWEGLVLSGPTYKVGIDDPSGTYLQILTDETITSDFTHTYIFNTPPQISTLPNASLAAGETYTADGSYTTQHDTQQTASVDYGDGSGTQPLALQGANFSLSHVYTTAGTFTITVHVTDNGGPTGTQTATVTVLDPNQPPTITTLPNTTINEGTTYTASANFLIHHLLVGQVPLIMAMDQAYNRLA